MWFTAQNIQGFFYYQPRMYVLTLFLPHPSTPASAVGIRSLQISRWAGGDGLVSFAQGGCQAMLVYVLFLL